MQLYHGELRDVFAIAISTFICAVSLLKERLLLKYFTHSPDKCHGLKMTAATSIRAFNGRLFANLTTCDFRRRAD